MCEESVRLLKLFREKKSECTLPKTVDERYLHWAASSFSWGLCHRDTWSVRLHVLYKLLQRNLAKIGFWSGAYWRSPNTAIIWQNESYMPFVVSSNILFFWLCFNHTFPKLSWISTPLENLGYYLRCLMYLFFPLEKVFLGSSGQPVILYGSGRGWRMVVPFCSLAWLALCVSESTTWISRHLRFFS